MSDIYTIKGLSRDLWIRDDPAIPANTKAFDIGGGRRRLIVHGGPINYWAPAGLGERTDRAEWDDIDPALRLVDAAGKAYGGQYLADRNAFTIGFRADGRREKFCGFRPLGRTDIQYETTLHSIVLDGREIPIPDEFAEVKLTSPTTIEHVIAEGISVWHQVGYRGVREAIRLTRPVADFRIVYRVHLTGATPPEAKSTKDGVTEYRADSRGRLAIGGMGDNVHIPRPVMWSGEDGITEAASREIEHRLYEQAGKLYYEKAPTERGREWLASQDAPLYIDGTTYYGDTADGTIYNRDASWSTARSTISDSTVATDADVGLVHASWSDFIEAFMVYRIYLYFDTSGIGSGYDVVACNLYLYADNTGGDTGLGVFEGSQGASLSASDFNAFGSASIGSVSSLSRGGYNSVELSSAGCAAINTAGTSRLVLRHSMDATDQEPESNNNFRIHLADFHSSIRRPYLDIEVQEGAVVKTVTDSGSGADSVSGVSVSATVADSGNGLDSVPGPHAALAVADSGTGVDSVAQVLIALIKSVADHGHGADAVGGVSVSLGVADSGQGLDAPAISASLAITDSGTGVDSVAQVLISVIKTILDAGHGVDSVGPVLVDLSVADAGMGIDSVAGILARLALHDFGQGVDVAVAFEPDRRITTITATITAPGMTITVTAPGIKTTIT